MDKRQSDICGSVSSASVSAKRKTQVAQLLAAVSVLGVSLGMSAAQAEECAAGQHCGVTPGTMGTSNSIKTQSNHVKGQAIYMKYDLSGSKGSTPNTGAPKSEIELHSWSWGASNPATSNQLKQNSIKGTAADKASPTLTNQGTGRNTGNESIQFNYQKHSAQQPKGESTGQ